MRLYDNLTETCKKKISDNMSELLIGVGLAGMFTSTVLACKATPKVYEKISKIDDDRKRNGESPLNNIEKIKVSIKDYSPAIISYGLSAACIISGSVVKDKKNTMLVAAYKFGESALRDYKKAIVDVVGEEKYSEIEDRVNKQTTGNGNNVYVVSDNNVLFFDGISGRYFRSNINDINKAINDINYMLNSNTYVSLNDFYTILGIDANDLGDTMGWNINYGRVDIKFSADINENGEPYIVIEHLEKPIVDYDKL